MKITIEATPNEIDKIISKILGRLSRHLVYTLKRNNVVKASASDADDDKVGYSFSWLTESMDAETEKLICEYEMEKAKEERQNESVENESTRG